MSARLLLTAAFAVAAAAIPAGAASRHSAPAATTQAQKYAACIASRDRMGSARLVLAEPGTAEEKSAAASVARALGHCGGRTLRGAAEPSHMMLRGLIAEQLWLTNVSGLEAGGSLDPNGVDFDKGFDAMPSLRDTYRLAVCVAAIRPEAVDALLRTPPSSEAEQAAFEALKQPVSSCFAHGRSLALERPVLRALLAEQLYRRYPPPGSGRRPIP